MKRGAPWGLLVVMLSLGAAILRLEGRLWRCACGYVLLWSGNIQSSDNSQHLFDPYSFTHVLHGFILAGLVFLLLPRLSAAWQFVVVASAEAAWEVVENSHWIIDRYRTATISLGYVGDTILNSFGDILACCAGMLLARRLGLRRTLVLAGLIEVTLLALYRDNLTLNIVMLIYPIDAIRAWQSGL